MIFDAHGDILTDVALKLSNGIDIWETYHLPLYKKAGITHGIFVNYTDPFSQDQEQDFQQITKLALPYFYNRDDVKIIENENDFTTDKFNLILGIEGLNTITSLEEIDKLYNLGYRHFGITWNEKNIFASGTGAKGGLTEIGVQLIQMCNRRGMIVDFAHLNYQSFMDASKITAKPILFSHGNVDALCSCVRNLKDDQLLEIKRTNGVIGLAAMGFFLNENKEQATIDDLINHILYIRDLIGIDHVGFGFDFCYYLSSEHKFNPVTGLHHIDDVETIIAKLVQVGLSQEEIDKVTHLNMLRVIKEHLCQEK